MCWWKNERLYLWWWWTVRHSRANSEPAYRPTVCTSQRETTTSFFSSVPWRWVVSLFLGTVLLSIFSVRFMDVELLLRLSFQTAERTRNRGHSSGFIESIQWIRGLCSFEQLIYVIHTTSQKRAMCKYKFAILNLTTFSMSIKIQLHLGLAVLLSFTLLDLTVNPLSNFVYYLGRSISFFGLAEFCLLHSAAIFPF
jgi:hypothetical protein